MPERHDDERTIEATRVMRDRQRSARRAKKKHDELWTREDFMHDLGLASRTLTREIEADPTQAAALDRSRRQADAGEVISQEQLDAELADDED